MKVALVNPKYLYGVRKVYLNCSLVSVAARLHQIGHESTLIDLNIDDYKSPFVQESFGSSDVIGVSLLGAPYIPSAVEFATRVQNDFPGRIIAFGGQTVENISRSAFARLFNNSAYVKQVINDFDFTDLIGENLASLSPPLQVSFIPVWERMNQKRLRLYMEAHEMTLEVSRGCVFQCNFCAARKGQIEQFRNLQIFEQDLRFLAQRARDFNLKELRFYASSLDFFQTPEQIGKILCILVQLQEEVGVRIKVRCLTCMATFLHARKIMEEWVKEGRQEYQNFSSFSDLLHRAGLWCIGFGVDGSDVTVWEQQNKRHNKETDVPRCIEECHELGIRTEILMVLGFPQDTVRILWKTLKNSLRYAQESKYVVVRPYLAKVFIPGNDGWTSEVENLLCQNPNLFYNLDYCALGTKLTNPHLGRRWMSNFVYIAVIGLLRPFGRCCASPLLPQGERGLYGAVAKLLNPLMPSDR